jgi:DNA adenine methylase
MVTPRLKPARPFLKWAGGKGQLLDRFAQYFPKALADGSIDTYIEPFLGGGAVFFHVMPNFPVKSAYLMDVNPELENLIIQIGQMEKAYLRLGESARKVRFLKVRSDFNQALPGMDFRKYTTTWVERTAQILFLNKTCFNGLFRVNSKGVFNVPFGSYINPTILNPDNLRKASVLLAKADIRQGDFRELLTKKNTIKTGSFIYYDPPYRPLSATASFTSYSQGGFGDSDQKQLAQMFQALDRRGVYQMLSNSDPKNTDPQDDFFEEQYSKYLDRMFRIPASRSINANAASRGRINEIVITSYKV